ncbi:MAG TPA: FAD-binding oxidoreductase [Allosphingosinicella sp.]|uniref:NAD(P)/FAD-dependent oxidoreductase n=1 Tax=Allosphingosinicella sp. TaxID=2823234 RepID=UPI002ED87636
MAARTADFIVIGGGIAGVSAACKLARHGKPVLLEAEEALSYHSTGRSAALSHYGIGNRTVRGLTVFSRRFFERPPEGFSDAPLCRPTKALFVAREEMMEALEQLFREMPRFTSTIKRTTEAEIQALCPVLKTGSDAIVAGVMDAGAVRLDPEALVQGFARSAKAAGAEVLTGRRVAAVERQGDGWTVRTEDGDSFSAPILINAAGAWADQIAELAGVRPLGLFPLRRTLIFFDPPPDMDTRDWPFVKTAVDDFYMQHDAGRLMSSPVDEVASDACDAQPEEYDVALAASKVEEYTTLEVRRVANRMAGLRSFVADRVPTAGFAPDAPGFFWLAGQGGYGLQTAPAMAEIVEALVTGGEWPSGLAALGVTREKIGPQRLFSQKS